jgi:biotin operon repressor
VLAALELLQTHKRISGAELARRLDVSVRTVRRYITALEDIGIPITADQGRAGAYTLVAGFKLPPMMFTDEEALAVAIGLLAVRELGVAEAVPAVDSAQAKLERVMPETIRHRLGDIDDTIRLDIANPRPPASNVPLGTLSAAAHAHQRIRLRYESPASGITTREFDPYGLSYQGGRWYAVGMCHLRRDMRTFRLDRSTSRSAGPPRCRKRCAESRRACCGRRSGACLRIYDQRTLRAIRMGHLRVGPRRCPVQGMAVNLHTLRRSWRTTEFPTGSGNHPIECRCRDPSELCSIGGLDRCDLRRTNH